MAVTVVTSIPPRIGRSTVMVNTKALTWSLAAFCVISFLVCTAYGLVAPESMHMSAALEVVLPGFRWLTAVGFVVGLVEAFLYGAYAGLVLGPLYNFFARRVERSAQ
jgi:hypothetical protein